MAGGKELNNRGKLERISDLLSGAPGGKSAFGDFRLIDFSFHQPQEVARIDFESSDSRAITLWLTPFGRGKCHLQTKYLNLTLQFPGKTGTGGAVKDKALKLLNRIMPSLGKLSWDDIENVFMEDSRHAASTDLNRFFDIWGAPEKAVQFFHYDAVWRYFFLCYSFRHESSIVIHEPGVYVSHGDFECPRNSLYIMPGLHKFFVFPWGVSESSGMKPQSENPLTFYSTDLDDIDVIDGGRKKFNELLNKLADNQNFKVVFISLACISLIIGDDLDSAITEFRKKCDVPIVFIDAQHISIHGHLAEILKFSNTKKTDSADPHIANLVGFAPGKGRDELISLLEKTGVKTNTCLLPDVGIEAVAKYMDAGLQIFHPNRAYDEIRVTTLDKLALKGITPPAPCGPGRTFLFLQAAAEAAGTMDLFLSFKAETYDGIMLRWEELAGASSEFRLGIVIEASQLVPLSDTTITWGIPILPVLEEMGFSLDILVFTPESGSRDIAILKRHFIEPDRHKYQTFGNPEDIDNLLSQGEFQAVYSDVFLDSRLSRNGKAWFSIDIFEPGIEGAFRTLGRLQALCRLPFYRRYSEYLKGGGAFRYER